MWRTDKAFESDKTLSERFPLSSPAKCKESKSLIYYVKDRLGHDVRYAINTSKIVNDLNFKPKVNFAEGLSLTLEWYLYNEGWWNSISSDDHQSWLDKHYGQNSN